MTWLLAQEGRVDLQALSDQYGADAPEGYCVNIKDSQLCPLESREVLTVAHGGMLVLEFTLEFLEDSGHSQDQDSPQSGDEEGDESSSSTSDPDAESTDRERTGRTIPSRGTRTMSCDRSRSPRERPSAGLAHHTIAKIDPQPVKSPCSTIAVLSFEPSLFEIRLTSLFCPLTRYEHNNPGFVSQLKLLTEPAPTTTPAEAALFAVRRIARAYDEAWPFSASRCTS